MVNSDEKKKKEATRKRNQLNSSKEARKKYANNNMKYQSVKFKITELEDIEAYCKENGIPKNTLLRKSAMLYIGKPFV